MPPTREAQLDEGWSFVAKKQEHCNPHDPAGAWKGGWWDHKADDPEHRPIPCVVPGARGAEEAGEAIARSQRRTGGRVHGQRVKTGGVHRPAPSPLLGSLLAPDGVRIRVRSKVARRSRRSPARGPTGASLRVTRHADGRETGGARFYIRSRELRGQRFRAAARGHRGIEPRRRVPDGNVRADDRRARPPGQKRSGLRRFAVPLRKRHPLQDRPRGQRIRRMMNTAFLTAVLTLQQH